MFKAGSWKVDCSQIIDVYRWSSEAVLPNDLKTLILKHGTLTEGERLCTVDLFIKVTCFVNKNVNIIRRTCGLYYKSFAIVIYDHIDSGQYYKPMIRIIIYDHSLI